ncbi:MAG: HAD family hydrolase [Bacillota bacterium]|nr:HAD family hydrolase [Bacillota bacterium]
MEEHKNTKTWKAVAIAAICILLIESFFLMGTMNRKAPEGAAQTAQVEQTAAAGAEKANTADTAETAEADGEKTAAAENAESAGNLTLWTENAESAKQLTAYVEAVTKEGSTDFIPVENRIAVFDLDGTLCSETNPIYFDHSLLLQRVLEDPEYKDKATDTEKDVAVQILQWIQDGKYPSTMDIDHGKAIASSFSGMTIREFLDYVRNYRNQPAPGYSGMTRGESFYRPMMEVLEYLEANGFTSYIVSGTDRLIVRGLVEDNDLIHIPAERVIGSDETLVARGQEEKDGLHYVYTDSDDLILGGEFIVKNLKMNKVAVIAQEIGKQPVLSFGNSTGDSSMAEYTITKNPYKSLAFMLCCDDTEREYGNVEKADKMRALCEEFHWIPVSMKDDWKTIYGDGVTKTPDKGFEVMEDEIKRYK